MAETGFGSITVSPAPTYNDWGFGSPTPVDLDTGEFDVRGRDTAFGSPFDAVQSSVFISGEFDLIPDDGGVILEINNEWSLAGFYDYTEKVNYPLFPFEVTFINASSGAEYDAIGEVGKQCLTNFTQTVLYAGVPPLPHGDYDVKVSWFDGTRQLYVNSAFTVTLRTRCPNAYGLRRHLPEWFATGPEQLSYETVEAFEGYDHTIEVLTKTVGEVLQRLAGKHTTATSDVISWGDSSISVESTIGFPESGDLFVGGVRFSYTSKTTSSFDGVSSAIYFNDIESRKEVAYVEPI